MSVFCGIFEFFGHTVFEWVRFTPIEPFTLKFETYTFSNWPRLLEGK